MEAVPRHIAIIMDGNGRWAEKRGLPRLAGHRAGVEALRDVVEACGEWGVKYLTLYAFSTENWKRPRREIDGLMHLLVEYLRRELDELDKKDVKIRVIGHPEEIPSYAWRELERAIARTRDNSGLEILLALNYGGRREIADAARAIARRVLEGSLRPEEIDERCFAEHLETRGVPDPELVIRSGGELRVSNFLLWQIAYAELWVTPVLWPDFRREHLRQAIEDFYARERRFGGLPGVRGEPD